MSNLNIENLSRMVQTGNVEQLVGGGMSSGQVASERRVAQEMRTQGMEVPRSDSADSAKTFSDILRNSVETVNQHQHQADTAIKELVAGRSKNIHETMLTIERADTSLKLMMQVRNKILEAYREIMRMQV